jgi:hypothetical protein
MNVTNDPGGMNSLKDLMHQTHQFNEALLATYFKLYVDWTMTLLTNPHHPSSYLHG